MKKINIITTVIVLGLMSANTMAQGQKHRHIINHEDVLNQLELDVEARQSLEMVMKQQKDWMGTLKAKREEQRYQDHLERRKMHEAHRMQVKEILTNEQFAEFEKAMWLQRHKPLKGHKMKGQNRPQF